jgi:glyoxylase-like metal-dependent hydrolase (beta-lactamase superfamily II)
MIHVEQHGPVVAIRMARSFLGRPLYWTAAYWIDGLLIDSGPPCTAKALLRMLEKLRVESVVVTHSHEDHVGGLAALRRRYPDVPIYASAYALDAIEDPTRLHLQLYRRVVWGVPEGVSGVLPVENVAHTLRTRDFTLRVVETPGHSRDHISLFEPDQRWLFCGDAFIGGQDRSWAREYDLFGVISSLRMLANLRPEKLFPGSGTVRKSPQPEIHEKIGSLLRLTREVERLDASGMNVEEMVGALFDGESSFRFWTGGHFSATNLIDACRSYNALMAPCPPAQEQEASAHRRLAARGASGHSSSANESADRGDLFR